MPETILGFTGHRPHGLPWHYDEDVTGCIRLKEVMEKQIELLINEHHIEWALSGMALGVDTYAAEIILKLKKTYPQLKLECVVPYASQPERWTCAQRERYKSIIAQCDKLTVFQERHSVDSFLKRNTYIADHADILIAVTKNARSGTAQTIRLAEKRNKRIIIISPITFSVTELAKRG